MNLAYLCDDKVLYKVNWRTARRLDGLESNGGLEVGGWKADTNLPPNRGFGWEKWPLLSAQGPRARPPEARVLPRGAALQRATAPSRDRSGQQQKEGVKS